MNILHINLADQMRGAAKAAFRLHKTQMRVGHTSRMLVGYKSKQRPEIEVLPARKTTWQKNLHSFVNHFEERTGLQYLWQPWKKQFLRHPFAKQAEVINIHNIHSGYFSHTILPELSRMKPVVWTLHDLWGISGHCSFPYVHGCERWKTGCGQCPALSDYPPIGIDTTAMLWRVKSRVYQRSDITLVTPSEWMADIVRQSPLLNHFEIKAIPYGLDPKLYKPAPKLAARKELNIPPDARVVLFAAFDLFQYRKGGAFLFDALQRLFDEGRKDLLLLTAGSEQTSLGEKYKFPMQSLGQINNEKAMAVAYNAADIYAGPSLAESFGLVYLESMACATPVVAFDCTAVSEVVRHKETGYLAKTKDVDDLAQGLRLLLDDDDLRTKMGRQSRELVEREYTLKIQAKRHIKLYQQAIDKHATGKGSGQKPPGSERNGGLPQSNGKTHSRQNADDERPEWQDPESHLLKDRKGEIGYLIDRALAFRIDPRETLVVSGFWRSGTTWLQESLRELLQAKTLFEPISPLAIDAQKIIAHHQVAGKSFEFLRMFLPYCGNETLAGYPLHELFRKSLQAELRGAWVRRFRKGLAESLRPRVVVKFTRAQLCLRAAQNTFSMPVIHVYRDPRAIVASIKKTRWHWLFDHLSLRAQLLELSDGRAAYFDQWYDDIMKYDEQDPVARVAAYWSLTEKFLQHSYADCPASIAFVGYEKLVLEREKIFAEILKKLGLRPDEEHFRVQNEDSTTTSKKRQKASTEERITGWKNILSSSEIGVIESVIQHFGFEDRLVNGSKINAARLDKGVFT